MSNVEQKLISAIKANDSTVFELIYKMFFPGIKRYIERNNGSAQDAEDILQEAIIVVITKVRKDGLEITTTFRSYLFSVCRLMWLMELRRRKNKKLYPLEPETSKEKDEQGQSKEIDYLKMKLYWYHFNRLSHSCRKLLDLFLNGFSMQYITNEMHYSSVGYTKLRNHQCKNYLKRNIKNDPRFQELKKIL